MFIFPKQMVSPEPAVSKQAPGITELVQLCRLTGDLSGGGHMQGCCINSAFVQSGDCHVQVTATAPTPTTVTWSCPLLQFRSFIVSGKMDYCANNLPT